MWFSYYMIYGSRLLMTGWFPIPTCLNCRWTNLQTGPQKTLRSWSRWPAACHGMPQHAAAWQLPYSFHTASISIARRWRFSFLLVHVSIQAPSISSNFHELDSRYSRQICMILHDVYGCFIFQSKFDAKSPPLQVCAECGTDWQLVASRVGDFSPEECEEQWRHWNHRERRTLGVAIDLRVLEVLESHGEPAGSAKEVLETSWHWAVVRYRRS